MDQVESTISSIADTSLSSLDSTDEFITKSFKTVLSLDSVNSENSQARAKITGNVFELCLEEIFTRFFPNVTIERHADLPEAGLVGNSAVDFLIYDSFGQEIGAIEAKGSPKQIQNSDGEIESLSRPGMKRTDTVKKAVSLGYQIQQTYNIPYYILTTDKPTSGSAKKTVDIAEGDVIQQLVDVTNPQEITSFRDELEVEPTYQIKLNGERTRVSGRSFEEIVTHNLNSHKNITDIFIQSEQKWLSTILEEDSSISLGQHSKLLVQSGQLVVYAKKLNGSLQSLEVNNPSLSIQKSFYKKGEPVVCLSYTDVNFRLQ